MLRDRQFVTVRDQRDSVWQSVVESTARREAQQVAAAPTDAETAAPETESIAPAPGLATGTLPGHLGRLIEAAHAQVFERDQMLQGRIPKALSLPDAASMPGVGGSPTVAAVSGLDSTKRCAALALQLAKATVFGTQDQVTALQNAIDFNVCDPFWTKCVDAYVAHFQLGQGGIPYRAGLNNVLPGPIQAAAKIALFGDWGTGMDEAVNLLQQIQGFTPDILIHLGDIYYSGTQEEVQKRFLDVCDAVFGSAMPRRFSLSGNHDMYSGGEGYYGLVDTVGQQASYFAIDNDDWLFIAMDTGVHDFNPFETGSVASFLMASEADWINNLIANKGAKKVVLFSHHPPFSAYEPMSGASVNPVLLNQLQASLPSVTAWFWGHEHRLAIYDSFQGIQRGRCLGHAAVPVFADATGDPPKFAGVPVHRENGKLLDMGIAEGLFKHGFALMTLNGTNATVSYYRQGESVPLWEETF